MTCCCRANVSRMDLACTSGLPSMSPPTQEPKRRMAGSSMESDRNGLGVHVRVAVHVTAHPGAEAQDGRELDGVRSEWTWRARQGCRPCHRPPRSRSAGWPGARWSQIGMGLACTSGLPSMSPPTQEPKRRMAGSSMESDRNGLGVHVRVAVHVTAHPGAEAQDGRELDGV